jgi:hypothetical protein
MLQETSMKQRASRTELRHIPEDILVILYFIFKVKNIREV